MKEIFDKAALLVECLPYIQKFRGSMVVVKFGGSAMEKQEVTDGVLRDIVLMECVGMKPIIVHGGGKAISARLKEVGIEPHFINGLRYTCDQTIGVVDDVLHNEVNAGLVKTMQDFGGPSIAVSGKNVIKAKKMVSQDLKTGEDIDLGFVGEVAVVDVESIIRDIEAGHVPVIAPLGMDDEGNTYNINADVAACKVAEALQARKLVFLSDVPGVLCDFNDEDTLISSITISEVDKLIQEGVISGGMIPKVESAVSALQNGVSKVHMVDGRVKHSLLLELLTDDGVGTQIFKG